MPRPNRGASLEFIAERGKFYVVWFEAGRKRKRSTGTSDSREAEAYLSQFIAERHRAARPAGPRDPGQFLIAEALDYYGTEHAPMTAAPERIAYAMIPLLDFWGERAVGDVTKETCRAYNRWRNRSAGTVRKELSILRAAFNFAVENGRLTRAPFVELPEAPEGKDRWLTKTEAARFLEAARTGRSDVRLYLPLFIMIALYTGARKGAILSLRWHQVDLEARRIDFNAVGERRTAKRKVRGQPIPDRLYTALRLARRRGSDLGFVVHDKGRRIKDIGDSSSGSFGSACSRAGLEEVSPHTLRHTCGTWMAQRGVAMHEIAGWLGHTTARTTELYAHHHPDFMENARRAADRR
ncbi:site-specific integrase [Novosphingobium sp. HII-3]|uniref:tyrosine-type recombinase/integrase n=1 Tax=Novosphingobium sp. HII-3 TaxID=2075565 RepID=UPI000CDAA1E6|nr:site-specific integrase [Novosphingobium sp. HII-3]